MHRTSHLQGSLKDSGPCDHECLHTIVYPSTPNTTAKATVALPVRCPAALLALSNGQESPGLRVAAQLREVMADDILEAATESN
jgi:hypothetical protein